LHDLYSRTTLADLLESKTIDEAIHTAQNEPNIDESVIANSRDESNDKSSSGPAMITRAVLFVYTHAPTTEAAIPLGSAFVMSIPRWDNKGFYRFLVTARHMVDPAWAMCDVDTQHLFIRFSKKGEPGVVLAPLKLDHQPGKTLFVPNDPHIDVAAILLRPTVFPHFSEYDVLDVPLRIAATPRDMDSLSLGTQIYTAGLDPGIPESKNNSPIFRQGYVANKREDLLKADCGSTPVSVREVLLSFSASNGYSRAPIFIKRTLDGNPLLVGVQSFAYPDKDLAGMTSVIDLVALLHRAATDLGLKVNLKED
jgi:hypothetical protein